MRNIAKTGITVKIRANHDGVRATVIMRRSIAASSSWRYPVIAVRKASEITSAAPRLKNQELTLISFPMRRVESHIGHRRRVLRRCHTWQSSCSCEFGCRVFIKHTP